MDLANNSLKKCRLVFEWLVIMHEIHARTVQSYWYWCFSFHNNQISMDICTTRKNTSVIFVSCGLVYNLRLIIIDSRHSTWNYGVKINLKLNYNFCRLAISQEKCLVKILGKFLWKQECTKIYRSFRNDFAPLS